MSMNVVLMASGTGSNAINLLNYSKQLSRTKIVGIIVNKKDSPLLEKNLNIPVILIPKYKNQTTAEHEKKILNKINELNGEFICLCGYMCLLSKNFIDYFYDDQLKVAKIFNIHPSLLPAYKGKDAYQQAFSDDAKTSGVTVHFVDDKMDNGKIFIQKSFIRESNDTIETFINKGKKIEWEIYPKVLDWMEKQ
jgi:phosphoribosylglycinamide formyltransferase-1